MTTTALYARLLIKAAESLGGQAELRRRLGVPAKQLSAWMTGAEPVPKSVLHKVVDLLARSDDTLEPAARGGFDPQATAPNLRH